MASEENRQKSGFGRPFVEVIAPKSAKSSRERFSASREANL
jgi:hypothetical protein